jgi:hypothetical protein
LTSTLLTTSTQGNMLQQQERDLGSVMKLVVLCVLCALSSCAAKGAGRAFPIESENFAIENFQRINPRVEWDETNFLVDLSGHYASCRALQSPMGLLTITRLTPTGQTITGVVDKIEGKAHDINSVNNYIQQIIKRWATAQLYYSQVANADYCGCSVRPGCAGQVIVACLFTPGGQAPPPKPRPPQPLVQATAPRQEQPEKNPTAPPEIVLVGQQKALAFTREQYSEAEIIMGRKWDRSHYLENLSGFETDCSMIGTTDWGFSYMKRVGILLNVRLVGQYGVSRNKGSTPAALAEILSTFKVLSNIREVGCSIIPHCINPADRQMYVVVACLYEEL